MVEELHTNNAIVQNTVTAYMLGMSLALVPIGMIADAIGRKKTLLIFLAVLAAGCVGCAMVTDIVTLLGLRFVQGMGGAACMVVVYAIAADVFRGAKLLATAGLLGIAWGLAPVLAPAAGGFIVQYASWRAIFWLLAGCVGLVALICVMFLPETLPPGKRSPVRVRAALSVIGEAVRHVQFRNFTLVYAAMASAQLVFGVVAPFLYQENLGFTAGGYGLIALAMGGANLTGEMACSTLATRMPVRRLCFAAWAIFALGALLLALSGTWQGPSIWAITLGGALALMGCGTLCPTMYGMAMGLFSKNLGLLGGFTSAVCCFAVSGTMAVAAYLPESSQAPMGWVFVVLGALAFIFLAISLPGEKAPVVADTVES